MYVVEFQKSGLSHAHMLIVLTSKYKIWSPDQFHLHVCAEIPDNSNPHLRLVVLKHMMHGLCGDHNPTNICMKYGYCKNHYRRSFFDFTTTDHNSYPIYRRRNTNETHYVCNAPLNNRWVVPYNHYLLAKFDWHVNVEVCSTIKDVKYLYKHIHEWVQFSIVDEGTSSSWDEIILYQSARWVSPPEATWRIYRFIIIDIYPNVIHLQFHLPNMHCVTFHASQNLQAIAHDDSNKTTIQTTIFERNQTDMHAINYFYHQFSEHYVWNYKKKRWKVLVNSMEKTDSW